MRLMKESGKQKAKRKEYNARGESKAKEYIT
jgi:hypothetical protein